MIPVYEIKKQLWNDPKILDHFIMSEEQIIDDIKLKALRPRYMALDNKKLEKTTRIKTPSIYDMIVEEI